MNMWAAIFGIVAISCITGVLSSYFKSRGRGMAEQERKALEDRLASVEAENTRLEERVRTLERIVTDGNYELKREFDQLQRR